MENDYIVREQREIKADLSTYLKRHEQKEMLRFLVAGSVDDGKSTLIGRLLYDSRLIYQDHLNAIYQDSKIYNTTENEIDLSLLTDGLRAEREQGITIDVAYRYFSTEKRSFIICDAPGHEQYTRNMATGASHCDLALILIDATQGLKDQTRRHTLIATLMGIRQIVVLVNKMDRIEYDEALFRHICQQCESLSGKLDIKTLTFIPISALNGDNVVEKSSNMSWYDGKPLLNILEELPLTGNCNLIDFRFPVQIALRPDSSFRGYAGNIASGTIRKGDRITILPSGIRTQIKSIETYGGSLEEAITPMSVVLTTTDEADVSRGDMLVKTDNLPQKSNRIEATLIWMDESQELKPGSQYFLKCSTQVVPATIQTIHYKFNLNKLNKEEAGTLSFNDIGGVEIITSRALLFDPFKRNRKTGSFILINRMSNQTCAGGIIGDSKISQREFESKVIKKKPLTLWFTGLSGSGKSTLAHALKRQMDESGINAYVLDGDELREGLNNNLGFSPEDRKENVRRVAEVARILNNAGIVSIVALISPYKEDRKQASEIIGENFIEIFVDADIKTCKKRDPKGLYKKVEQGEITGFTGIDAPYEKPENPDIIINTAYISVENAIKKLVKKLSF